MAHPAHALPASWTIGETLTFFTAPDAAEDVGRVPILERQSLALVGLVARRDLLRVRTNMVRHELEREALIKVLPPRRQGEGA